MKRKIVIIGAGELGSTLAILLDQLRFTRRLRHDVETVLIDLNGKEQHGAKNAANIYHETGYEYFKPDYASTGRLCIEGAITKHLMFPEKFHQSPFPNRFLVSNSSDQNREVPYQAFKENAERSKSYYAGLFAAMKDRRQWSYAEALRRLGTSPERFGWELKPEDFAELAEIRGGFGSAGGAVNMALDYAIKRSALDRAVMRNSLTRVPDTFVSAIRERKDLRIVETNKGEVDADIVICCAAHKMPAIAAMAGGPSISGTYYLNAMQYVVLPATTDKEMVRVLSNVNFVLQGENGCMYACLLPPTGTEHGVAAIYFPSERGSQIDRWPYTAEGENLYPPFWDEAIARGHHSEFVPRTQAILKQAFRFNPFLEGYIQPLRLVIRTVFNPASASSGDGLDRRVREMFPGLPITRDGRVLACSSPKWTTSELSALTLLQQILVRLDEVPLPACVDGFGPLKLDVCTISDYLNLQNISFPWDYAIDYARDLGMPDRIVPTQHPGIVKSTFRGEDGLKCA